MASQERDPKDKVLCETPTPGKAPTRIPRWKYDLLARAILRAVPRGGDGVPFRDLPQLVAVELAPEEREGLGSLTWHVTTVKLDLEAKGRLARVPGATPQRLRRTR